MTKTNILDPQGILKVVDAEVNKNATATGAEDLDQSDVLTITGNDTPREIVIAASNAGETVTQIPIKIRGVLPDFRGGDYTFKDDMNSYTAGDWTLTQASSGTAATVLGNYGELQLAAGAATADQGVQLQSLSSIPAIAASEVVRFGARVNIEVGTTNFGQMFVGLAITDTSLIAAGVMAVTDYVGFQIDAAGSAAGTVDFELNSTTGSLEATNAVATLVKGTAVDLEFIFDGVSTVTPYINGTAGTAITVTNAPEGVLRPSLLCQAEGTDSVTNSIDWMYVHTTTR